MTTHTIVHVVISLVGIASGLVVLAGLLTGKRLDAWTALFLTSTMGSVRSIWRSAAPFRSSSRHGAGTNRPGPGAPLDRLPD